MLYVFDVWQHPFAPPRIHQLLGNHSVLAGDSSSGSDRGTTYFFKAQEIQPREQEKKNKEQMNNKGLGQLQVQEGWFRDTAFPVHLQTNAIVNF